MDGVEAELPPALICGLGNDPKKKTILLYGKPLISCSFFDSMTAVD